MTDGIETKIFRALTDRLTTFVNSDKIAVAYPNVSYKPVEGTPYLRPNLIPAPTDALTLDGSSRYDGILQVDVFWPEGQGIIKPMEKASAIIAHFPKQVKLFHEGVRVVVNGPPYIARALQEPGWLQLPINIPYTAFVRS